MSVRDVNLIGIAGVARSGKDTLYRCLSDWLAEKGVDSQRIALADQLKASLQKPLADLGIDVWSAEGPQKNLIRPFLVEYGRIAREMTDGSHWTSLAIGAIKTNNTHGAVSIVTDIRYCDCGDTDELAWLKRNGGKLFHVSRYGVLDGVKVYVEPPNEDERRNDPILRDEADYRIEWPTMESYDDIYAFAKDFFEKNVSWNVSW